MGLEFFDFGVLDDRKFAFTLHECVNIPAEYDIYVGESRTRRGGVMRLIYVNKKADV